MSKSKFNCGKFCNRRLKGFGGRLGDAKMATAPLVLAVKAVRERECGVALEALGRAKALLTGPEKARPIVQRTIKFVETACPKSRFVPVRADVVEALRLAPGTELPSTWGKSVQNMMQGRLRKPKARRVPDKKASRKAGRPVFRWKNPSKEEMDIWQDMAYRHARPADTKHPEHGSRSMYEKVRPRHSRKGAAVKRRRGRPKKR